MEVKGRFPASPTLTVSFTFFMRVGKGGGGGGGGGGVGRGGERERERGCERNCSLVFPLLVGLTLANWVLYSATFSVW